MLFITWKNWTYIIHAGASSQNLTEDYTIEFTREFYKGIPSTPEEIFIFLRILCRNFFKRYSKMKFLAREQVIPTWHD